VPEHMEGRGRSGERQPPAADMCSSTFRGVDIPLLRPQRRGSVWDSHLSQWAVDYWINFLIPGKRIRA